MIRVKYSIKTDDDHYELEPGEDGINCFCTEGTSTYVYAEEPNADQMLDNFKLFLLGLGYSHNVTDRIRLLDIDQVAKLQLTE